MKKLKPTGIVFVSFKNPAIARVLQQCVLSKYHAQWISKIAPVCTPKKNSSQKKSSAARKKNPFLHLIFFLTQEPRDVIWENHEIGFVRSQISLFVVFGVSIFIVLFWIVPVGFSVSLANLETLSKYVPFLNNTIDTMPDSTKGLVQSKKNNFLFWISTTSFFRSFFCEIFFIFFFIGILPSLVVTCFNFMLTPLLTYLSLYQGYKRYMQVEKYTFQKFFFFLVVNVFFVSLLTGSFFSLLGELIYFAQNPYQIVVLLVSKLPVRFFWCFQALVYF